MKPADVRLETIAGLQATIEEKIVDIMLAKDERQEEIDYVLEELHVTIEIFKNRNC